MGTSTPHPKRVRDILTSDRPGGATFRVTGTAAQALRALSKCRTGALGAHAAVCTRCQHVHPRYNSCRNRHCPECQGRRRVEWSARQASRMLAAPHFMVVFTLPGALRPLARSNPEAVYDALLRASGEALARSTARKYGARFGVTSVLHTWTREMTYHPHVHAVVSGVGLGEEGLVRVRREWLLSAKRLSALFRSCFLRRLSALAAEGSLSLGDWSWSTWRQKAEQRPFIVHVEPPRGRDVAGVVRYLAAYVNNVAISDRRVLSTTSTTVTIAGRMGPVTLSREEFVRRWSLHVLPKGFRKVRHTGLYAPGAGVAWKRAQEALGVEGFPRRTVGGEPPEGTSAAGSSEREPSAGWVCERCGWGELVVVMDLQRLSSVVASLRGCSRFEDSRRPP